MVFGLHRIYNFWSLPWNRYFHPYRSANIYISQIHCLYILFFIRPLPEQPLQNVRNLQQQTALATASKLSCHELRTSAQLTIDNQRQAEAGPLDTHPLSQHTFWHSDMFYGHRAMYISSQTFFSDFFFTFHSSANRVCSSPTACSTLPCS